MVESRSEHGFHDTQDSEMDCCLCRPQAGSEVQGRAVARVRVDDFVLAAVQIDDSVQAAVQVDDSVLVFPVQQSHQ